MAMFTASITPVEVRVAPVTPSVSNERLSVRLTALASTWLSPSCANDDSDWLMAFASWMAWLITLMRTRIVPPRPSPVPSHSPSRMSISSGSTLGLSKGSVLHDVRISSGNKSARIKTNVFFMYMLFIVDG